MLYNQNYYTCSLCITHHVSFISKPFSHSKQLRYRENHTVWQKLLLVPLIFILLRLYSAIIEIPVFYLHGEDECHFRMSLASAALTFLAVRETVYT